MALALQSSGMSGFTSCRSSLDLVYFTTSTSCRYPVSPRRSQRPIAVAPDRLRSISMLPHQHCSGFVGPRLRPGFRALRLLGQVGILGKAFTFQPGAAVIGVGAWLGTIMAIECLDIHLAEPEKNSRPGWEIPRTGCHCQSEICRLDGVAHQYGIVDSDAAVDDCIRTWWLPVLSGYKLNSKAPFRRGFFLLLNNLKLLRITVCLSVFFKP